MPDEPKREKHVHLKAFRCRRTGQIYEVEEHVQCPYCSADAKTIENSDDYDKFCEFRPGDDPVNFGLKPDADRFRHG